MDIAAIQEKDSSWHGGPVLQYQAHFDLIATVNEPMIPIMICRCCFAFRVRSSGPLRCALMWICILWFPTLFAASCWDCCLSLSSVRHNYTDKYVTSLSRLLSVTVPSELATWICTTMQLNLKRLWWLVLCSSYVSFLLHSPNSRLHEDTCTPLSADGFQAKYRTLVLFCIDATGESRSLCCTFWPPC